MKSIDYIDTIVIHREEILSYKGHLDYDTIGIVLKKLSRLMDNLGWNLTTKKKVYCAMVESLENIDKHKDYINTESFVDVKYASQFSLVEEHDKIRLVAGNIIANENINNLKERLDRVNSLDENELRELYKKTISSGVLSEKGGAGLGIINIAKTSKNKLNYSFEKINDDFSYFTIDVLVNLVKEKK